MKEETCPCEIRPTDDIIFVGDYWASFRPDSAYYDTPEKRVTFIACLEHNRQIVVMRDKEKVKA